MWWFSLSSSRFLVEINYFMAENMEPIKKFGVLLEKIMKMMAEGCGGDGREFFSCWDDEEAV